MSGHAADGQPGVEAAASGAGRWWSGDGRMAGTAGGCPATALESHTRLAALSGLCGRQVPVAWRAGDGTSPPSLSSGSQVTSVPEHWEPL